MGEAVVLDPVRGRGPGPTGRGVLAIGGRRELLEIDPFGEDDVIVQGAVLGEFCGQITQRVAQLVEQRHVLDRE